MEAKECSCGRPRKAAEARVYHSGQIRHTSFLCACGQEWTVSERTIDPRDPVSSEEVIEIHQKLENFEGPLSELF